MALGLGSEMPRTSLSIALCWTVLVGCNAAVDPLATGDGGCSAFGPAISDSWVRDQAELGPPNMAGNCPARIPWGR
jgi:hypothetical protein